MTVPANGNGAILLSRPGWLWAVYQKTCVMTGQASGRVARAAIETSPNAAAGVRAMIAAPSIVGPGGSVVVAVKGSTASDTHNVFLDGAFVGTAATDLNRQQSVI